MSKSLNSSELATKKGFTMSATETVSTPDARDLSNMSLEQVKALALELLSKPAVVTTVVNTFEKPQFKVLPTLASSDPRSDKLKGSIGTRTNFIHQVLLDAYISGELLTVGEIETRATKIGQAFFKATGASDEVANNYTCKAGTAHVNGSIQAHTGLIERVGRGLYRLSAKAIEQCGGVIGVPEQVPVSETTPEQKPAKKSRKK
jgi:hypothetical protein